MATQSTLCRSFVARALVCRIPRLFKKGTHKMRNEFTSIMERDGEWYVAYSPEIPGANGQGRTEEKALSSLKEAIALIVEIPDMLARKVCRRLSIVELGG